MARMVPVCMYSYQTEKSGSSISERHRRPV